MTDRLLVATRKGLFFVEGGTIRGSAFLGDPVTMALFDVRDGTHYAALHLGHFGVKLHRSGDFGTTWEEIATPRYPEGTGDDAAPSLRMIWSLETGGAEERGVLWAGTIPGGLFRSNDRGSSWEMIGSLWNRPEREQWFGGGFDQPGIHSVCVDPRDASRVAVGVSCGGVWVTGDSGKTWKNRAQGMRAEYMPPERAHDPDIQDPHRLVQCAGDPDRYWVQHHNGIFRTLDETMRWEEISGVKPSTFGFAVAVHPRDPDLAWFVPASKDERRFPVDGRVVVTRTRDGGKKFDVLRTGLPQEHAYDIVYRHGLDVDASGDRLAFGTTTGSLYLTDDQGDSWREISAHLPPIYCVRFVR